MYDNTVVEAHPAYAELVNDLTHLSFGRSYWLYATEAVTLSLGVPTRNQASNRDPSFGFDPPPATFYGPANATQSFTVGMAITATINGTVCGESQIVPLNGQLVYKIQIEPNRGNECEEYGQPITFTVGEQIFDYELPWDNGQAWYYRLGEELDPSAIQLTTLTTQANDLPWRRLVMVALSLGLLLFAEARWRKK